MAEIKTIIRADSTQHNQTVKKSANEIYKYQKKVDDAKKSMGDMGKGVKNVAGLFLGKLIPAIGGAMTAMEGFKKIMKSTEEGTDAFEQAIFTAKSSVNQFFKSINTTGSFDKFILGLKDIKQNAEDAYTAIDKLGSVQMWVKFEKSRIMADKAVQNAIISNPNSSKEQINAAKLQLQFDDNQLAQLSQSVGTAALNAANKQLYNITGASQQYVSLMDLNKALEMRKFDDFNGTNTLSEYIENFRNKHVVKEGQTTWVQNGMWGSYSYTSPDVFDSKINQKVFEAFQGIKNATDEEIQGILNNLQIYNDEIRQTAEEQNKTNKKLKSGSGGSGTSGGSGSSSPTYESGSIAELQAQIKALNDEYNNGNLTIERRKEILLEIEGIEEQIETIQREAHGMPKIDLLPTLTPIPPKIDEIVLGFKKIPPTLEEIEEKIREITDAANDMANEISGTFNAVSSIFGSLANAVDDADAAFLNMIGDVAGHVGNIISQITKLTAAEEAEALAAGIGQAAKTPYPYNIAAIASIVAELVAVFSTVASYANKYAEGGIVGGSTTIGDYNLARVNKGEMILNGKQQSHLFNMLNGVGMPSENGVSGNVVFRISGSDLVGTLNNYNSRTGRVR